MKTGNGNGILSGSSFHFKFAEYDECFALLGLMNVAYATGGAVDVPCLYTVDC